MSAKAFNPAEDSGLWSVHCSFDNKPVIRAWTHSKAEAEAKLEELKRTDRNAAQIEYWILPLSKGQVEDFKAIGFIPKDVRV